MNRSTLRFSIAFMLFVCLCVAGFLGGYRAGVSEGYASGRAKRQSEEPFPKVYEVGDIIRAIEGSPDGVGLQLDYDSLSMAIQTSIFPAEWEALGGSCTMCPIPQLESVVVNATSGVHDGVQTFLADLSSVKRAVATSKLEAEDMRRRFDEWMAGIIQPVSEQLGTELTLVGAEIDLVGSWDVQQNTPDGMISNSQYVFVDADTVRILTPDGTSQSADLWYIVSPGSVVVSGKGYIAATTKENALVLVPREDPLKFMVATPAFGEP